MILVRQDLCPTLISSDSTVEQVWVRLSLGDRSLYVGGAYIPPRSEVVVYSRLVESCAVIADQLEDLDEMLLVCDLNLPGIGWREDDEHPFTDEHFFGGGDDHHRRFAWPWFTAVE